MYKEKCAKCDGGMRNAYSIHGRRIGLTTCPYCGGTGRRPIGTDDEEKDRRTTSTEARSGSK